MSSKVSNSSNSRSPFGKKGSVVDPTKKGPHGKASAASDGKSEAKSSEPAQISPADKEAAS